LKVLIVSQYFWPETFRINEIALSLRDAGAEVTVLTGKPNYPDGAVFEGWTAGGTAREAWNGIPVLRVPMLPRGRGSGVRLGLNYLSFALSGSVVGPWLLRGRPFDVILVYGISPILQGIAAIAIKLFKRAPVVLWVQDLWPQSLQATGFVHDRRVLKAVEWVVRGIYRFSDMLLVQSQAFREPVATLSSPDKIRFHPNPGELALDAPRPALAEPPVRFDPTRFNAVFAGNLGNAQAVETIVEAAALLVDDPRIRFVLVGSGSRSDWIRQEAARRGLSNVALPGRFPPDAMPSILDGASVLLVTLTRSEIFGLTVPSKIQAYLAAGKPVLAALDGEGARVIEEAGAGISVPAEDAAALADAMRRMADMPASELARIGRSGRDYYDAHFAPAMLAGRMLDLFSEAVAARHPEGEVRR
jgi:glycosyltransferase involved in cell wall biosynthesis